MKVCILVTGMMDKSDKLKNKLKNTKHLVVWSTWSTQQYLIPENDLYITIEPLNTKLSGYEIQKLQSMAGALVAIKHGADFILRIRSDMWPTDIDRLIEKLDLENVNLLGWHDKPNESYGIKYYLDFLISAPSDQFLKVWKNTPGEICFFTEHWITNHIISNRLKVKYILPELKNGIDIFWEKHNYFLSYLNNKDEELKQYRTSDSP